MKKIDKSEIGAIISKSVNKVIQEYTSNSGKTPRKELILEFAITRKDLANRVISITPTLFSHWCLCKYASASGDNENLNHWRGEVFNYIYGIRSKSIKPKDDRKVVEKLISQIWLSESEYDRRPDVIETMIFPKFEEENLANKWSDCTTYATELSQELNVIIRLMAYENRDEILNYAKQL